MMELSTWYARSSWNILQTIGFVGEINPESSQSCAGFSPVYIHMVLAKTYHQQNSEKNFVITTMFFQWITSAAPVVWQASHQYVLSWQWRKCAHIAMRIERIRFSLRPMFVGLEHSKSTCSSAGFSPVCIVMAVKNLSTYHHQNSGHEFFITIMFAG